MRSTLSRPRASRTAALLATSLAGLFVSAFASTEKPLWEAGIGVGAMSFPAYRGADQRASFWLPVPYLVYHGQVLKSDRHGTRAQLFESDRINLTISAALSPPVSSRKILAREGMPDLAASFEVGPQIDFTLWQSDTRARHLKLQLPLRAAFSLEHQPKSLGWVFHPKLNLDLTDQPYLAGWNLGLQAGPLWGDKRQHRYFYGVTAPYANASRPAYEAGGGFAGMQYLTSISKRYGDHWVGAFVRYDNLNGARFVDSPLVRSRSYAAIGVAVSWILGESTTRVLIDD